MPFSLSFATRNFWLIFYVVVDAIGLEIDFTLETNRKRVKEKLLKRT